MGRAYSVLGEVIVQAVTSPSCHWKWVRAWWDPERRRVLLSLGIPMTAKPRKVALELRLVG